MIDPACCSRMIGRTSLQASTMLFKLIAHHAIERLALDLGNDGVTTGQADADVQMEDVDSAPLVEAPREKLAERVLVGGVRGMRKADATLGDDAVGSLLSPGRSRCRRREPSRPRERTRSPLLDRSPPPDQASGRRRPQPRSCFPVASKDPLMS